MRYMFLIYSNEHSMESATPEEHARVAATHGAVMAEARTRGAFVAADPLEPTRTATTVRMDSGRPLITDGPFAETKEQLAGYYILDCRDLDEALEWAARIPTACLGGAGCVEVRPLRAMTRLAKTPAVPVANG
jgi:hypothetical protein